MSLSIGAAVKHDDFATATPLELFRAADECMYMAKGSSEHAYVVEFSDSSCGTPTPVSQLDTNQLHDQDEYPSVRIGQTR